MIDLTQAQQQRLAQLAGAVALEAPVRTGAAWTPKAKIPWDLVIKIRAVLEEAGFDWRKAHAAVRVANGKAAKQAQAIRARAGIGGRADG